jgi:hypothetical protein
VFISGKFLVSDSQFRQLPDFGNFGDLFPPRPAFFSFLLQTKTLFKATQAWPLRGAWVAPWGYPSATQTQSQSAEGRRQSGAAQTRDCHSQFAGCQVFQRACAPRRCLKIPYSLRRINCESGQVLV